MTSLDGLLADLIAQAAVDQDAGLVEWSDRTTALRDAIVGRFADLERRVRAGSPERPEVQVVQGGPDTADPERGSDLPRLRRLAAEAGATFTVNTDPLLGTRNPVAASMNHHIEILGHVYAASTMDGFDRWFEARMDGFVCGPCRTWEMHRSIPERNAAIARHTGRPYFS